MQIETIDNDKYLLILDRDFDNLNRSTNKTYTSANLYVEKDTKLNFAYFKVHHQLTESETVDIAVPLLLKMLIEKKIEIKIKELNKVETAKLL